MFLPQRVEDNDLVDALERERARLERPVSRGDDERARQELLARLRRQAQDLLATLTEQTVRGVGLADVELRYVAPELLTGQTADVRSDVFTMGVLAYEMATARRPYEGTSMPSLLGSMLRSSSEKTLARSFHTRVDPLRVVVFVLPAAVRVWCCRIVETLFPRPLRGSAGRLPLP